MTHGPSDPNHNPGPNPPPGPGPHHPGLQRPGTSYPLNLWPDYAQQPGPGGPQGTQTSSGSAALSVVALFLGLAGLVAPFLPFSNLIDRFPIRQYLAFPFAVPALALAIVVLAGTRRGKPAAAIGMILAALALLVGVIMVYNYDFRS
ncbi:hypothetical protein AB0E69_19080 [Kribbella sp. NPDC026611]|uniref:hypothetical protein n=1 Tax=Kribbella sp. NPDC026611 TaxID=3154911 RepID=UPI0033BFF30C